MASILRVKLRWSGYQGGPGFSVFHFRDSDGGGDFSSQAQAAVARVDTFKNAIREHLPQAVSLQVESDVEEIEETNGELVAAHNTVPAGSVLGNASSTHNFAAAVGAVINWRTGGVRNGRRVRGKTFLVPLNGSAFATDGTLAASTVTSLNAAGTALINATGSPDLGVYARPTPVKDAQGNPIPGEFNEDGIWHLATSVSVPDMGAVLRSRRD